MFNKICRRVLSITLCIVLLIPILSYADTVIIGQAPTADGTTKTMTGVSNTTYLTNTYTGPGTVPTSATTTGVNPIQGLTYDQSIGQIAATLDNNNVSTSGPTVTTISSPAAHNAELASFTSSVVANNTNGKESVSVSTADAGPTVYEIDAPVAGGERARTASKAIVNGQEVDLAGPGTPTTNSSSTTTSTDTTVRSYVTNSVPSYSSSTVSTDNTGVIVYQCNDTIQAAKPSISSSAAIIVNATTRQIYFSKGGFTKFHPAGLTALVTGYLLLRYKGLDDVLTVSSSAVSGIESGAITAGLRAGDTIKVRDCLGGLYIQSCADIANVVAENVSGSVSNFVALMNRTVKEWGCIDTNFVNPTGLNSDAQVTTTYDAAIMMDKATNDANLKIMLAQYAYVLPATANRKAKSLKSKNYLLTPGNANYYAGATSRMGYTSKAKYTVASSIDYNGCKLIAVVLHANTTRFTDSTKLLNFGKVAAVEAAAKGNVGVTQQTQVYMANSVVQSSINGVPSYTTGQQQVAYTTGAAVGQAPVATAVQNTGATSTMTSASADTQGSWAQDSNGWYFVKTNGTKASNEWIKVNGKMYCVDSAGYMITGWREMSNGKMYYFDTTTGEFKSNTWINLDTGAYYLQADGSLAKADAGTTKNIVTTVGTYTIDSNGKAIAKVS